MAKYVRREKMIVVPEQPVDAVQQRERVVVNVIGVGDQIAEDSDWIVTYGNGDIKIIDNEVFVAEFDGPFADGQPAAEESAAEESAAAEGTGDGDPQA